MPYWSCLMCDEPSPPTSADESRFHDEVPEDDATVVEEEVLVEDPFIQKIAEELAQNGCSFLTLVNFFRQAYLEGVVQLQTSVEEIAHDIVLIKTAVLRCCFVKLLPGGPRRAQKYVSHWWGASYYSDVLACLGQDVTGMTGNLLEWFLLTADMSTGGDLEIMNTSYWLHVFSSCLHNQQRTFREIAVFDALSEHVQELVVVLDPKLVALSRMWVVNEIATFTGNNKRIHYYMPRTLAVPHATGLYCHGQIKFPDVAECDASTEEERHLLSLQIIKVNVDIACSVLPAVQNIALMQAVIQNREASVVEKLLDHHTQPHLAVSNSLLNSASFHGLTDVVKLLLKRSAELDGRGCCGETALYQAAQSGHSKIASLLLEHKAQVNKSDRVGCSPVHMAAHSGHSSIVSSLIQANARINKGDFEGLTPLHYAALGNHGTVAKILISARADVQKKNLRGLTPHVTAELLEQNEAEFFLE